MPSLLSSESCESALQALSLNLRLESEAHPSFYRTTPLPFAYNMHLRATTYVYLVFLPFQIYSALGYLTIPAMFIASCVFLGFLELGTQLENPFGYDARRLQRVSGESEADS